MPGKMNYLISAGIIRHGNKLMDSTPYLLESHQRLASKVFSAKGEIPKNFTYFKDRVQGIPPVNVAKMSREEFQKWEDAGIEIEALAKVLPEKERDKLVAMGEGEENAHLILEIDGQFKLLKVAELEKFEETTLDADAIVAQLQP